EAEAAHAEYQRARKAKREFAHFETQSDQAKRRAKDLNTSVLALEQWRDAFANALPIATATNRCPVCSKYGTLQRRDPTTFTFECGGCDTLWGVRSCGGCK
ncbi:MAG TPA: hypothetical protein PK095_03155, partial [Myxococcota bacterium]|nr:hypothetical protein [Myxococcota bacterium]